MSCATSARFAGIANKPCLCMCVRACVRACLLSQAALHGFMPYDLAYKLEANSVKTSCNDGCIFASANSHAMLSLACPESC